MTRAAAAMLALVLAACASPRTRDPEREAWTGEWNARVASAASDAEHPCATRPFIAWADAFLADCEPDVERPTEACARRNLWVRERVEQCKEWTAWMLRNFGRHERIEGTPPSMRVE